MTSYWRHAHFVLKSLKSHQKNGRESGGSVAIAGTGKNFSLSADESSQPGGTRGLQVRILSGTFFFVCVCVDRVRRTECRYFIRFVNKKKLTYFVVIFAWTNCSFPIRHQDNRRYCVIMAVLLINVGFIICFSVISSHHTFWNAIRCSCSLLENGPP